MLWESIREALMNIRTHKLRSFLSVLGVTIGVGSVIVMVSIIEGARHRVVKEFELIGSNLIFVVYDRSKAQEEGKRQEYFVAFKSDDVSVIRKYCPSVAYVSPEVRIPAKAYRLGEEKTIQLVGITEEANFVLNFDLARGRLFTESDIDQWRRVCIIGWKVAEKLFHNEDPLGKEIRVQRLRLTVIGVLSKMGRVLGEHRDDFVYVPLPIAQQYLMGNRYIHAILAKAVSTEKIEKAADEIWQTLRNRYGDLRGLRVDTQRNILQSIGRILAVFSLVLGGIGALALLVGGIGIMNIMLVSVTERIREIGVRKAIGARNGDIMRQFLIESMTLSSIGGLFGMAFGWGLSWLVGTVMKERLPTYVPIWTVLLAFGFAMLVGLVFGIYPAIRASKLEPVECLRYE
ncbi:MAG: ABC transporter permease [Armatimonadetes bacterium]|nr:ABC transporter permease [Armatimonadota bacterium]MDW8027509.1 ABC transporter permease [Armatimonadota bacterium]